MRILKTLQNKPFKSFPELTALIVINNFFI